MLPVGGLAWLAWLAGRRGGKRGAGVACTVPTMPQAARTGSTARSTAWPRALIGTWPASLGHERIRVATIGAQARRVQGCSSVGGRKPCEQESNRRPLEESTPRATRHTPLGTDRTSLQQADATTPGTIRPRLADGRPRAALARSEASSELCTAGTAE